MNVTIYLQKSNSDYDFENAESLEVDLDFLPRIGETMTVLIAVDEEHTKISMYKVTEVDHVILQKGYEINGILISENIRENVR